MTIFGLSGTVSTAPLSSISIARSSGANEEEGVGRSAAVDLTSALPRADRHPRRRRRQHRQSTTGGLGAWIDRAATFSGDGSTGTNGEAPARVDWRAAGPLVGPPTSRVTFFVDGTLTADVKDFKIDHPLDPANKYLVHTSVESSEMMNIYSGNVTTDELGLATVTMPDWFEAENTDFRYQLTVVDERFAQAVVSKRIANHQFTIHTNASNVQVSWQITAVRQDVYAKAHPLVVEQVKGDKERGFYQHPELSASPRRSRLNGESIRNWCSSWRRTKRR